MAENQFCPTCGYRSCEKVGGDEECPGYNPNLEADAPSPKGREEREGWDDDTLEENVEGLLIFLTGEAAYEGVWFGDDPGEHPEITDGKPFWWRASLVRPILAEVLRRLRTHSPEEPTGWQPIETAPKDEVLLYFPRYQSGRDLWLKEMIRVGYAGNSPRRPTHWMPLPAPPLDPEDTP